MNIFQELKESKMFGSADTLDGKKSSQLADMAYLMMLMLELQRKDMDKKWAKQYAEDTIRANDFESMKFNCSDLHNLLSVLNHLDVYEGRVKVDRRVSVPVFGLWRYFREVASGDNKDSMQDRNLFSKLESELGINDAQLKNLRRTILYWGDADSSERKIVYDNMKRMLNKNGYKSDIAMYFATKI